MGLYKVEEQTVRQAFPKRRADTHKGDYGRVLIVSGAGRYTGAPFFCAQAAVNTGSGLVFLAHPEGIHSILAQMLHEPILLSFPQDEKGFLSPEAVKPILAELSAYDVCLAGPGLGRGEGCARLAEALITSARIPLVLDADCLNALAGRLELLRAAQAPIVLTPHAGEFARLQPSFEPGRRAQCAAAFAREYGCILVLKGAKTLTALPSGELLENTTGNPGMAKGGSGDVLAGVIASLVGQGIEPERAAYIGVWLHGRAGDLCRDRLGEYGMTPTDMLADIKRAIQLCQIEPASGEAQFI